MAHGDVHPAKKSGFYDRVLLAQFTFSTHAVRRRIYKLDAPQLSLSQHFS